MSLTSYRAAPPRGKAGSVDDRELKGSEIISIRLVDLAATYSPAP